MNKFKYFIILSLGICALVLSAALFPIRPSLAATNGCCQVLTPSNGNGYFETTTLEECQRKNQAYAGSNFKFEENNTATPDGKGCTPPVKDLVGSSTPKISNPISNPTLSVTIPGFEGFRGAVCANNSCSVPWLADYINAFYRYGIGSIALLAVIVMMIAGVIWLTAGGKSERVEQAQELMRGSLFGILIAVTSFMVLNIINPALTKLSPIKVTSIQKEDLPDIREYQTLEAEIKSGETSTGNFKPGPSNIVAIEVETMSGKMKIQVDQSIADATKKAFVEMKNIGFSVKTISDYRPGSGFCHSQGLAIDVNAEQNYCIDCYGVKNARVGSYYRPQGPGAPKDYQASPSSMEQKVIEIWTRAGWCWGGNWNSRKDYMHFSSPTCRNGAECGKKGRYDFSKSVKENHAAFGITYP